MKIYETKPNHINEGPLDLLTRSGRAQRRAFKTGQQVSGTATNNLKQELARYLGSQGKKSFDQADTQDVIDFLDSKGVDTSDIDKTAPMNAKRVDNIIKQKVQQTMALKKPASAPSTAPASQGGAPAPGPGPGPGAQGNTKTASAYSQTLGAAQKLSAKEKRRLIQQLQKGLPPTKVPPIPLGRGRPTP